MRRRVLRGFAFVLAIYVIAEGVSLAGLQFLRMRGLTFVPMTSALDSRLRAHLDAFLSSGQGARVNFDPDLGWVPRPGPEMNTAGMRDDRDYDIRPAPGTLRISAFGDSFVFGSEVDLGENWAKRISALKPTIEVLNYGVMGYGLDQAYLRYLKGGALHQPHIVFIGFMTENLARNVNVYRNFYAQADAIFSKPRFRLEGGALTLLPNPLKTLEDYRGFRDNQEEVLGRLGRNDYFYPMRYPSGPLDFSPSVRFGKMLAAQFRRKLQIPIFTTDGRYEPRSEAYEVTLRIFDEFHRRVLESGALPVIVVLPEIPDQVRSRGGKVRRYGILLDYFTAKGYRYIDTLSALQRVERQYTRNELTAPRSHLSKLGNDLVARYILEQLGEWNLDEASEARAAAVSDRQRLGITKVGQVQ